MLTVSHSASRFARFKHVLAVAALFAFTAMLIRVQAQSSAAAKAPGADPAPASSSSAAAVPSAKHAVTLTFNYDFTRTPACSDSVKKKCIAHFNVYDVSGGAKNRIKLFTIPVPAGATKVVNGISAKSPELVWEPGKHHLAVTAQMDSGSESTTLAATVWVTIPSATADASNAPTTPKN